MQIERRRCRESEVVYCWLCHGKPFTVKRGEAYDDGGAYLGPACPWCLRKLETGTREAAQAAR
jgi:hypothetical protein